MKNQSKCISVKTIQCEQSLVFRFMRTAKWVALSLMTGIGVSSAFLQMQRHQDINWMFFSICLLSGVILFWIGHCIMKGECITKRRCGSCNKVSSLNGLPIRQM